jgi:hypothetical protein
LFICGGDVGNVIAVQSGEVFGQPAFARACAAKDQLSHREEAMGRVLVKNVPVL